MMDLYEALERWRACPDPLLAAWIEQLDAKLPSEVPQGTSYEREAWMGRAIRDGDPTRLRGILAILGTLRIEELKFHLERLHEAWPDDPRLVTHHLGWLEAPFQTGKSSRPVWNLVLKRLARSRDPRIASLQGRDLAPLFPRMSGEYMNRARARTVDRVSWTEAELPAAERQALEDALHTAPDDVQSLWEALLESPDDPVARQIYADALLGAGDPRGEYLQLALAPRRTRAQTARARALLKEHESTWLGPLDRVFHKSGRRWEQGFLVAGTVRSKSPGATEAALGHPLWAFVRSVHLPEVYGPMGDRAFELVLQPHLKLTTVTGLAEPDEVHQVLEAHPTLVELGTSPPADQGGWWTEPPVPTHPCPVVLERLTLMSQLERWLPWFTGGRVLSALHITTVLDEAQALGWWSRIETLCTGAWSIDATSLKLAGTVGGPIQLTLDRYAPWWTPTLLARLPRSRVKVTVKSRPNPEVAAAVAAFLAS